MSSHMKILMVINQPAYGCEIPYNAMRLAAALCWTNWRYAYFCWGMECVVL